MTSFHALRLLTLAGLGALGANAAQAQGEPYYYGGLSVGQSRAKIDQQRISAGLLGAGLSTTSFSRDESGTGYKLFGGYQFNRNFGVEAGYFNLGKFGFHATTAPAGTLDGQIGLQGLNLDLVGTLPLTERLSAIGRVGAQYAKARDNFSATGAVSLLNANPSKGETLPKVGLGLQYAISNSLLVRAEAERYRVNDAVGNHGDVNLYSVSLVFPFGREAAPRPWPVAVVRAPMPAPEPMPAAAPVYVAPVVVAVAAPPVAVPPPRKRVSFSADSLFAFDQSTITEQGRAALDAFARELQGIEFDQITVEGHTDRLGSTAYNQKLSIRRADAVKAYLVGATRLDPARVNAVGKGEASPVTHEDCKGNHADARLISCLQPDRRVEVEVTGTR